MPTSTALTIVHYTICTLGMIANCTLLFIVLRRTPKKMKTYGAILATSAIVDFITAATSCATFVKSELFLIYAFTGPCTYLGSFQLCLILFAVTVCGHAFFAYTITLCFCFRLVAIRGGTPSARATITAITLALLPNIVDFLLVQQTEFELIDSLRDELIQHNRTIDSQFFYYKYKDLSDPISLLGLALVCAPYTPAYVVIVFVFLKIRGALNAATSSMSARTKSANVEIIKGLVIQSCLPVIDICAVGCFLTFLIFETSSEVAEHLLGMCIELVCTLHPLISLYFVRPYRVYEMFHFVFQLSVVIQSINFRAIWNLVTRSKVVTLDFQTSQSDRRFSLEEEVRRKKSSVIQPGN